MILIDYNCPACGNILEDEFSGEKIRCEKCGVMMIENRIKNNGQRYRFRDKKEQ